MITKQERTELRSVVRQQFRVLRTELEQREVELTLQVDVEVDEQFSEADATWHAFQHKVHEITMEANRATNDALVEFGYKDRGPTERMWFSEPHMQQPRERRNELRSAGRRQIEAQAKMERLRLDRQEADLLKNLAVGALESEEAHAFLAAIPSVGELVPGARLAELEASLAGESGDPGGGNDRA